MGLLFGGFNYGCSCGAENDFFDRCASFKPQITGTIKKWSMKINSKLQLKVQ
jgi:hypothetical protein